jgi:hypothetical protein
MPNFYNRLKAIKFSTASDTAVEIGPSSSATPNFAIDAGGKLKWSSGSAVADANLYRTSAGTLKTDGSLEILVGLTAATPNFTGPTSITGSLTLNGTNVPTTFVSTATPSGGSDGDTWMVYS